MPKNASGAAGEQYAAKRMKRDGYRIIAQNYRTRFGEIDLIAESGGYLVFAEVKTRRSDAFYRPAEAVTREKQHKIIRAAYQYLDRNPTSLQPRFDVIEIIIRPAEKFEVQEYAHICDAFGVDG